MLLGSGTTGATGEEGGVTTTGGPPMIGPGGVGVVTGVSTTGGNVSGGTTVAIIGEDSVGVYGNSGRSNAGSPLNAAGRRPGPSNGVGSNSPQAS